MRKLKMKSNDDWNDLTLFEKLPVKSKGDADLHKHPEWKRLRDWRRRSKYVMQEYYMNTHSKKGV